MRLVETSRLVDMRISISHNWSMTYEFACHSALCAPPVGGSLPGPNPQMIGRPHYTESKHVGMYHTWDEKGRGGSMSGLEQAKRFVKGRETTLKRVKTQTARRK